MTLHRAEEAMVSQEELGNALWRKSSKSGGTDQCINIAPLGPVAAIRDSKSTEGRVIIITRTALSEFLNSIKQGRFKRPSVTK